MNLRKLIYDDGSDTEPDYRQPAVQQPSPVFSASPEMVSTVMMQANSANFAKTIADALDADAKEPGLKEFNAQFAALSTIIKDRGQCTAAALAAVQASNSQITAKQIAKAVNERMDLLGRYDDSYTSDCTKNEAGETKDKSAAVSSAQERIFQVESELARLSSERAQLTAQIQHLKEELAGVTTKYDAYRSKFHSTIEARRAELRTLLSILLPGK